MLTLNLHARAKIMLLLNDVSTNTSSFDGLSQPTRNLRKIKKDVIKLIFPEQFAHRIQFDPDLLVVTSRGLSVIYMTASSK